MYHVSITTSGGTFDANFESKPDIRVMVQMVGSGAQVRDGWSISIYDKVTKANLSALGQCTTGMTAAVECLLEALSNMPKRPRGVHHSYDVTVPVHLAVDGGMQLVDAEDFVRRAVQDALNKHAADDETVDPMFMYNGDCVSIGSAKEA